MYLTTRTKYIQVGIKLYWNKDKTPNGNLNPQINGKNQKRHRKKEYNSSLP